MPALRSVLIWALLGTAVTVPVAIAATSPFLAWRDPIYILAGFSGIVALVLLLLQPVLAGRMLPGLNPARSYLLHRWIGCGLVLAVVVHVVGLWITSPPDVIDALLFVSPTPFSAWGVIAMIAIFASAALAWLRRRMNWRPQVWRRAHVACGAIVVSGSIVHAVLIEGTMGPLSKSVLCVLVFVATIRAAFILRIWRFH
ncbi:MAG: ferric reductase [Rhodobacteraceae bacterium]|nr:ferric reductase [Paracoccaceae bacterium]